MRDRLLAPFDPETFRQLGHGLVDQLASYLQGLDSGPVLPWRAPEAMVAAWPADFSAAGRGDFPGLMGRVLAQSHALHHPRYVGHQVTSPLPVAVLAGMVGDLLNNGTAIYEMGPVTTAMERNLCRWFAGHLGWDGEASDGFLTSGGSAGNLTALLAARQHSADWDVWEEGGGRELCLVASDQAHYSVSRAARIMGLGSRSIQLVESDGRFRMRLDALRATLDRLQSEGRRVMAVVGSAGSTATGAIDPLEGIGEACRQRGLWFHVDGAHGGALALSPRLRDLLKGIELADSTIVDAHKMLLVPALATLVLFREGEGSFSTFSQQASYLFGAKPQEAWYDLAQRTLECTKRMMALKLWAALDTLGTDYFVEYLEHLQGLSARFADMIRRRPGWHLAVEPEQNIICFRFAPEGMADPEAFQLRVRRRIVEEGSFYLVKTRLRDHTWLRCTLINPRTTEADLQALLERVEHEYTQPTA